MNDKLYKIYTNVKTKCYNSKSRAYKNYGGKGIKICDEWLSKEREGNRHKGWLSFYKWALSHGYKDGLTLDRIDITKDFCPENCYWVSLRTQSNNIRYVKLITYKERTQSLSEWCQELQLSYKTVLKRLNKYHWTVEEAFTEHDDGRKTRKRSVIYPPRLRKIYFDIKARCYNPKRNDYKWYGGKGVSVCDEWLNDEIVQYPYKKGITAFCEWALSNGYKENLTIDRIDSSKNYSPENCRWISIKEQQSNKSSNTWITYKGKTQTLQQWSKELNMYHGTIRHRLYKLHWSIEKAFETPVNPNRKSKLRG